MVLLSVERGSISPLAKLLLSSPNKLWLEPLDFFQNSTFHASIKIDKTTNKI